MKVIAGEDGVPRCEWCVGDPLYERYHDDEWGRPVRDDVRLFEKICLEGFQSGLSWLTILRKRENFRRAFAEFDIAAVARFGASDFERLMSDAGIVRNRAKIEATINNAARCLELIDERGSLAAYVWGYEPASGSDPQAAATAMSKDLRRRGWAFVGPVTAYSFMEAMGLVNDHLHACAFYDEVEADRRSFTRPRTPAAE